MGPSLSKGTAAKHNFENASLLVLEGKSDHWNLIQYGLQKVLPAVKLVWVATASEALDYLHICIEQDTELPLFILLDLYLPDQEAALLFYLGNMLDMRFMDE